MKKTQYYNLFKPDGTDAVDIQNFNDNFDAIDEALHDAADASGDLSKGAVYANVAASRTQIESGNTLGTIVGKIMKWFVDIKDAAFAQIANNDATTSSGYVLDARVGKEHGDEIDKLNTQMGGLYLGQNASGKWGYKTSPTGAVNPFRNPAGNAGTGDVLAGKTFANASSDSLTGTMPNNGSMTATLTPTGNNTTTKTIPAGYTTGGTITADGRTAYAAGKTDTKINATLLYSGTILTTATYTAPSNCVGFAISGGYGAEAVRVKINGTSIGYGGTTYDGYNYLRLVTGSYANAKVTLDYQNATNEGKIAIYAITKS